MKINKHKLDQKLGSALELLMCRAAGRLEVLKLPRNVSPLTPLLGVFNVITSSSRRRGSVTPKLCSTRRSWLQSSPRGLRSLSLSLSVTVSLRLSTHSINQRVRVRWLGWSFREITVDTKHQTKWIKCASRWRCWRHFSISSWFSSYPPNICRQIHNNHLPFLLNLTSQSHDTVGVFSSQYTRNNLKK